MWISFIRLSFKCAFQTLPHLKSNTLLTNVSKNPTRYNSMQIFIYCKVTLHVSGVTAPIIGSTKNANRSLWFRFKKTLLTIKISIILRGLMQINAALKVFVTHIVRDGRSENFIIDTIRKFVFHTALRRPLASTQLIFSSRNLKLFPNR
jgi:hypothetical protein